MAAHEKYQLKVYGLQCTEYFTELFGFFLSNNEKTPNIF